MTRRTNAKGRNNYPEAPYWSLPYATIRHDAFRALSGASVKVLLELRSRYQVRGDGRSNNNGDVSLALGEAATLLGLGKATVQRALVELEQVGFIERTSRGQWYGRKAATFRLTDVPCKGQPATRDWQRQHRENQSAVPIRTTRLQQGSVSEPHVPDMA